MITFLTILKTLLTFEVQYVFHVQLTFYDGIFFVLHKEQIKKNFRFRSAKRPISLRVHTRVKRVASDATTNIV